jgi:hypothetical protein
MDEIVEHLEIWGFLGSGDVCGVVWSRLVNFCELRRLVWVGGCMFVREWLLWGVLGMCCYGLHDLTFCLPFFSPENGKINIR